MSMATSSAQSGIVGSTVAFNESPNAVLWGVLGVVVVAVIVAAVWFVSKGK